MGILQEVGATVYGKAAAVEDDGAQARAGRVHAIRRLDVPDVLGDEVDPLEAERVEGSGIDVGEITILHREAIDPEIERHRLESLLPALVLQGNLACPLRPHLSEVEVKARP